MVTINDIAHLAGVAKSTVSRYLNGGSVSAKTHKKIQAVIDETGYVPNSFAQSLRAQQTKTIGAIIPRMNSQASAKVIAGAKSVLEPAGWRLMLETSGGQVDREIQALTDFQVNKVDGILWLMTQVDERVRQALVDLTLPVIPLGQPLDHPQALYYQEYQAGQDLATYVYQQGYRRLHYLTVPETDLAVGVERYQGFCQTFLAYPETEIQTYETGFELAQARQVVQDQVLPVIAGEDHPLIVGASDTLAFGAIQAFYDARDQGIIDEDLDLALAGFGNDPLGAVFQPRLTTVDYPYYQAGTLAAQALLANLAGSSLDQEQVLAGRLVVRNSLPLISG